MVDRLRSTELGELLERLKDRSDRSYESIGKRALLSKSTVHRYCKGTAVPQEFGVVERIALTCGASRAEMELLHRLWLRATALDGGADSEEPGETTGSVEAVRTPVIPDGERTSQPVVTVRRWRRRAMALLGALLVLTLAATSMDSSPQNTPAAPASQWIAGPSWTLPPTTVPRTLFGVTINSGTGTMPAFRVGAVRFWDGGTRWSEIQRERGEFDWSAADRLTNGARNVGLPALFVFGGTPRWASPAGPTGPYPEGTPAPPVDLADWDTYVRAVVERYRGRIEAYELWVLANDRRFYAGSPETLVEMTRRASGIIRSGDPGATVVCPGMGELWTSDGVDFLRRFAKLGGFAHCDVAGIKLFQRDASEPPETMVGLTASIDRVMHEAGIHPRLWSTGTTYSIALQRPLDERKARNYAIRFYLVGIYARNVNLERMYFYNWGGTKIPIVLQPVSGAPTAAALAVEQLQRWLQHARSTSCGHGISVNLPNNAWQCEFTVTENGRTHAAIIRWTDTGTATTTADAMAREVRYLDGSAQQLSVGDDIKITEEPLLIVSSR